MPKLTQKTVDNLRAAAQTLYVRDDALPGFFVKASKTKVVYKAQVEHCGQTRARTLGRTTELTLKEARNEAQKFMSSVRTDPSLPRFGKPRQAPTLESAWRDYIAAMEIKGRKPRSIQALKTHARELGPLARRRLRDITPEDCFALHEELKKRGPIYARAVMVSFRAVYNRAKKRDRGLPDNPVDAVAEDFAPIPARNRVLTPDELPRWFKEVDSLENDIRRRMHLVGICTGLRPDNLRQLRCEWYRNGNLYIPAEFMKRGKDFTYPICERVQNLLSVVGGPYFFPTRTRSGKGVTFTKNHREKSSAFLTGADCGYLRTGHILRHTFGTIARVCPVPEIHAQMLMHHSTGTNAAKNYIHAEGMLEDLRASHAVIVEKVLSYRKKRHPAD